MSTPLSVAETFPCDALAGQDVQIALLAEQVEHLAEVGVGDVYGEAAIAAAINAELRGRRIALLA